jgi:hypothetical protein
MKPVIMISSCKRDQEKGYHDAIRSTWGRDAAIPFYFLMGAGAISRAADELVMDLPDDYNSLPFKTREGHRWASAKGYDYIFQAFTDTYCFTNRMLVSGFERFDYVGHFRGENVNQLSSVAFGCYPSGGSGYWLSPMATSLLVEEEPDHWAEDLWVGRVMKKYLISGTQDYRYFSAGGYTKECLTVHLSRGTDKYHPSWMEETHATALKRGEL